MGLPPIQSGGLPFQNMGGNPLGFLNQNNPGGQNKYIPQRAQVIGNRLGYPQQGGATGYKILDGIPQPQPQQNPLQQGGRFNERPSQQNELQQTERFAGMPKVNYGGSNIPGMAGTTQLTYLDPETGTYGSKYPGSPQFPAGERDDNPGTAPGWVRPQQGGGTKFERPSQTQQNPVYGGWDGKPNPRLLPEQGDTFGHTYGRDAFGRPYGPNNPELAPDGTPYRYVS
jgi:hypothetical protein